MRNCNECIKNSVCSMKQSMPCQDCSEQLLKSQIAVFEVPLNSIVYVKEKVCKECEHFAPELYGLGTKCRFGYSDSVSCEKKECKQHIKILTTRTSAGMYSLSKRHSSLVFELSSEFKTSKSDFEEEK